jgi:hypothetical protein
VLVRHAAEEHGRHAHLSALDGLFGFGMVCFELDRCFARVRPMAAGGQALGTGSANGVIGGALTMNRGQCKRAADVEPLKCGQG